MVRPIKIRKLYLPHPTITFSPVNSNVSEKEKVILLSEEYHALRLIDYESLNHSQAAKVMGISRPTITRIYDKARKKIATALIEIRELEVKEGNTTLHGSWYKCKVCESEFNIPDLDLFQEFCPVCNSSELNKL